MKMLSTIIISLIIFNNPSLGNDYININDSNLRQIIKDYLGAEDQISISQMLKMEFLCIDSSHITNLKGIGSASNLLSLRLYNSTIDDISEIKNLSNLKELSIRNCNIKDIAPLENLTNLNYLIITDSKVKDISVLSNCKDLTWLDLSGNQIMDISAFANLKKVKYLNFRDNPISVESLNNIQMIVKNNNPDILINLDDKPKDIDSIKLLNAKATFSNFIYSKDFKKIPGIPKPLLPDIPDEIKTSMDYIEKYDDLEYLADISYMLVKYAIEIDTNFRPSPLIHRDIPVIKTFFSKLKLKPGIFGDDIVLSTMTVWICNNRDKFGPSALLDIEIEKYQNLRDELSKK